MSRHRRVNEMSDDEMNHYRDTKKGGSRGQNWFHAIWFLSAIMLMVLSDSGLDYEALQWIIAITGAFLILIGLFRNNQI